MKNNLLNTSVLLLTTILTGATHANLANAQTAKSSNSGTGANGPLLANAVAGKLLLKADVGYVYSFAGDWSKTGNADAPKNGDNKSAATGGVGYGVSLGWTSKSGFGLSADYLGFNHKWSGGGTGTNAGMEYNYDAPYHVMTITPSYRFKLDSADNWGLRVGLGVGFSLSDVNWANKTAVGNAQSNGTKVAGGAVFTPQQTNPTAATGATGCVGGTATAGWTYSDSLGGPSYDGLGGDPLQCFRLGLPASVASGLTDKSIAGLLAVSDPYLGIANADFLSYGVWRLLFNNSEDALFAPNVTTRSKFSNSTSHSVPTLETREQYVARCDARADHCASYNGVAAGTYANGEAAAAAVDAAGPSAGGSAKDDAGFVLAPQVALEYDNNLLHFDINVKYIHGLLDVRYFGSEGAVSGSASSGAITYTSKAGPLALFIGAGLGINF
ncbi:MAG: hypothetical protein QM529_04625 [Hydrotalea sp.]|nr:hypothetical protein [Hydrotalea sp.]